MHSGKSHDGVLETDETQEQWEHPDLLLKSH